MKNDMLRAPLIKSAVLLLVFSLIIYLTVTSPEGSIWSSLGAIFYTVFKAAQLGVGLILALVICFAVLAGIFFVCVAMISTDSARKMYNDLQKFASDKTKAIKSLAPSGGNRRSQVMSEQFAAALHNNMVELNSSVAKLKREHDENGELLSALQSRLEQIEQDESITKLSDWLRKEEEKSKEVHYALERFDRQLQQMKNLAEDERQKVQVATPVNIVEEITGRTDALENLSRDSLSSISALQKKVEALSQKLDSVQSVPAESSQKKTLKVSVKNKTPQQRLFSYIASDDDQKKVEQLVAGTLEKEMTYAQVVEYVSQNVTKRVAKVLKDHPKLTTDYIREYRKKK